MFMGTVGCVHKSKQVPGQPSLGNGDVLPSPDQVNQEIFCQSGKVSGRFGFSDNGYLYLANFEKDGKIARFYTTDSKKYYGFY